MGEVENDLIKVICKLAITKQLNFLIGSGASTPEVPLMGMFEEKDGEPVNDQLNQKVREVSQKILANNHDIQTKLGVYQSFLQTIVSILNLRAF